MKTLNAMMRNLTQPKGMGSHRKFLRKAVSGFSVYFRKLPLCCVEDGLGRGGRGN